jgi:hypothetical protein
MPMLGTALIHQLKKVICQIFTVMVLKTKWLLEIIGAFLTDQMIPFVTRIGNQFVLMLPKIKVLLVHYLTIVVSLIKRGLILARQILGVLGTKLATIAHKILQLVKQVLKREH